MNGVPQRPTCHYRLVTATTAAHFHPLPGAVLLLVVAGLVLLTLGIDAVERRRFRRKRHR